MMQYLLNIKNYKKISSISPRINLLKTYDYFSYKYKKEKYNNLFLTTKNNLDIKRNRFFSIKHNLLKTHKIPHLKKSSNKLEETNSLSYKIFPKKLSKISKSKKSISLQNKNLFKSFDNIKGNKNVQLLARNPLIIITENNVSKTKKLKIKSLNFSYFNKEKINDFYSSRNNERLDITYQKFNKYLKIKKCKQKEKERNDDSKKLYCNDFFFKSFNVKKLSNLELNVIKNGYSLLNKNINNTLNKIN